MSLVKTSLITSARCPYCARDVDLGECERAADVPRIELDEVLEMVTSLDVATYRCAHLAPDGPHVWLTEGPLVIWPVPSLHVAEVRKRWHDEAIG